MKLPTVDRSQLDLQPIKTDGLPKRFLNPGELEVLVALVRNVGAQTMLEIGVNDGRTAKAMMMNVPSIRRYIGVDVPMGYVTSKVVQRREIPARPGHLAMDDPRFSLLLKKRGSMDLGPTDLPRCDVVFIDGDHGRDAVMHDSGLARAIVKHGGLVIWHDYHDRGTVDVREVLDEMFDEGAKITHVKDTWIAYEHG